MSKESGHVSKFREKHLRPEETIIEQGPGYIGEAMGSGKSKQQHGALIVTSTRVAFYRNGFFGEIIETMPIKSITSVERQSFMGFRSITLHTSHDSLIFKTFQKDVEQRLMESIEKAREDSGKS